MVLATIDAVLPSANSAAAVALLRLAALTGEERFERRAHDIIRLLGGLAAQHPMGFSQLIGAIDMVQRGMSEVVIGCPTVRHRAERSAH